MLSASARRADVVDHHRDAGADVRSCAVATSSSGATATKRSSRELAQLQALFR